MDTDLDLIMTIDSDDEVINSELDDSENEEVSWLFSFCLISV